MASRVLYVIEGVNPQTGQWEPVRGPVWHGPGVTGMGPAPVQPPTASLCVFPFRDQAEAAQQTLKQARPELASVPLRVVPYQEAPALPTAAGAVLGTFGSP